MEAAQVEIDGNAEISMETSYTTDSPVLTEHSGSHRSDCTPTSSAKRRKVKASNQVLQEKNAPPPSVSNCYIFKSRLQEYAQKAGLRTPVYETVKEGPSHQPSFRSTVIVNNVRYDSLPGFFNRKAAEQSAAEVALIELAKCADTKFGISQPVHETGLSKNLLQEYAQKMNYAIPWYECRKDEKPSGGVPMYSCTVEVGGIKYVGASASTKKEAEIKAARTALLAIQSSASSSEDCTGNSLYTVVPPIKNVPDPGISTQETAAALKPKTRRFKKQHGKWRGNNKQRNSSRGGTGLVVDMDSKVGVTSGMNGSDICLDGPTGGESTVANDVSCQGTDSGLFHCAYGTTWECL